MSQATDFEGPVLPANVKKLLATVTALPPTWVALMCFVAIAAALDIRSDENGIASWHVAVGSPSLIALALIWLPAVLQYLVLKGGSVRAAGIEATTSGLLSDRLVGDLAEIRSRTEKMAQDEPNTMPTVQKINTAIDDIAARYLPAQDALSEEMLNGYARDYEKLRETMPPGDKRTREMDRLTNEVRIRAATAPDSARRYASTFLRSPRQGDRVVGLALVEGAPTSDAFDDVLRIFGSSATAFEQFHSLQALSEVAPALGTDERHHAVSVLQREKTDPRGVGLMNDASIPWLIDDILSRLK